MRICKIVDLAVPADHKTKLKENEKMDKNIDLAMSWKKLWYMKVTFIPIVIGALGIVTEGLIKRLENLEITKRVDTIQTITLLRTASKPRRVLET